MAPTRFAPRAQTALLIVAIVGLLFVPGAIAQVATLGQWTTLPQTMPINPIHVTLLHNGKILVVAGSGNCPPSQAGCPTGPPYSQTNGSGALVYDPVAGTFSQLSLAWDMFCNSMVALADGRVLITGGTMVYDPFLGSQKSSIFDPGNNSFTDQGNMAHGRWYPTSTLLPDGRVMAFSGQNNTNGNTNLAVEFFTVGSGWSQEFMASWTPPLYPRMHVLPNGNVFVSGPNAASHVFNPTNTTWTLNVAFTNYGQTRTYGSSILLPLTPGNGYEPRVILLGGNNPGTTSVEFIDIGASSPAWVNGPAMSQGRVEMNAILLPNGKVLAVEGSVSDESVSSKSLNADLFNTDLFNNNNNPDLTKFVRSSAGANAVARLYHSVALLLPDATVWLAGGNPSRGSYDSSMEIYKPTYLFNSDGSAATRPSIGSAPATISWAGPFTVSTPDAATISSVVLVRPGSPTHAFDQDQRLVGLSFTVGSGSLSVTGPPNKNIAPPGYYMLFLLNSAGVPSVAKFVQVTGSGSAPAPGVSSIAPTSGTTAGGTAVTITGSNFQSGASLSFGGSGASNVNVASSTSITATTPTHTAGAVNVVVTNPDSQSATLSNGFTYTSPNPAPTVGSIAPVSGTTAGGTPVTITGTGFVAGATVKLGGTAATGVVLVSSTSITATTPTHAAGAASVVVTNSDGQSGTLANGYTYTGSGGGGGSIAFVQVNAANPQSASASVAVAYSLAQTAGNLNVVAVGWNDTTSTVNTISDTRGNSYSLAVGPTTGTGVRQSIYYAKNIAPGSNTVTVTFNQAAQFVDVRVLEYSGADTSNPLDKTAGAAGSGTTASSGATATTTSANELIFGAGMTSTHFTGAGTGFVSRIITNPDADIAEDQTVSSTGSYTATAPATSSAWVMQAATFRASGGSGNPAPTVTGIAPTSGTTAGGTAVTITGTGFLAGPTVSVGGTAATGVVLVSSTSITANTPAHAAGAANVVVTNTDAQFGTLANGYTYVSPNPAPTVTGIAPTSGTTSGGTAVTITGTGFLTGVTVKLGGTAGTNVVLVSSTSITATAPAHAAGAANVVVTNTDAQFGTLTNGYTYTTPNPAPTVTGIAPTSGTTAGGTAVTITGTGFLTGATASVGGTAATNVVLVSSTSITATAPAHAAGAVNVVVTNTDAQFGTLTNGYTYTAPNPAPTVASIAPTSGTTAGGTAVTITGTGFLTGATVSVGGTAATNVVLVSSTSITANTPAHAAGAANVVVTNTDAQFGTLTNGYTYTAPNPAPTVTGIAPTSGTTAGGTAVTITGTGFLAGVTVKLGGTAATGVVLVSSTSITANTPAHAAGAVNVVVTNTDAQFGTLTNGYTYVSPNPAPTVTGIAPTSGTTAGGTAVTITGTGFLAGVTVSVGGTAATGVVLVNSTSITAITPAHAAGAVNIVVTNTDAQFGTLTNGYTYTAPNPAPTVTGIAPTSGTTAGGTAVTITGTGFLAGATVSVGGTAATGVVLVNSTSITAITPAHAAGAANVVVTNTDAQFGTLLNGYTYTSSGGGGPITFVQVNAANPQSPSASVAVAYPLAQTAGNLNIVAVGWNDTAATVSTISDTRGNTYSLAVGPTSGTGLRQSIYYAKSIAAGSNTVTVTFNQAAVFVDVRVLEYSGLDTSNPLDQAAGAAGSGTTASSGATATTTSANELIFGAGMTTTHFTGAGTGFVSRIITNPDADIAEDKAVSSTGSYTATAPATSSNWVMQVATFRSPQ